LRKVETQKKRKTSKRENLRKRNSFAGQGRLSKEKGNDQQWNRLFWYARKKNEPGAKEG